MHCGAISGAHRLRLPLPSGRTVDLIDAPGGGGKVPINPGYILYHDHEKIVIRNYEGKIFEYPELEMAGHSGLHSDYPDEYLYS